MKAPGLGRASLFLAFMLGACLAFGPCANAQTRPGSRTTGAGSGIGRIPDPSISPESTTPTAFISGKVTLDDGTELTEPAAIQTICRGDRHTRTYTDHHGSFSFEFGDPSQNSTGDLSDASSAMVTRSTIQRDEHNWRDCEVQAVLGGFSSQIIDLTGRMNALESTDVGRIVLHRLEHVEGTSVSVTSALAPSGARKELEKGREAERKKNWDHAVKALQKAVQIYPKYAAAWFELGRVQMVKNEASAAKVSFQQALAADPKYVPSYRGLAELAFQSKQWPEVVRITEQMLALNPVSFPAAYFFNAVANYYLTNLDAAEKSARQGIKIDSEHQITKLYYVLGIILLKKQNYQQAELFFHQYMQSTTETAELEAANKQLAEIAKLSPPANSEAKVQTK
ncbi:MAG TPA: tetratricopeptide repeat protein [Terriglobales bacterium]|jgi:tetratricopeptide (TPR) repeat protein|nr:tetratricopeptide repeat protein [Terriglobales bacterium]